MPLTQGSRGAAGSSAETAAKPHLYKRQNESINRQINPTGGPPFSASVAEMAEGETLPLQLKAQPAPRPTGITKLVSRNKDVINSVSGCTGDG
jgi:hypothetical protein